MDKHISKHEETRHLADDIVHYREYKILLQPDRFTSKEGFIEFWEKASKTLKKLGLKVDLDDHAFDSQVREVLFYDTPGFDLFNNHFILRKRRIDVAALADLQGAYGFSGGWHVSAFVAWVLGIAAYHAINNWLPNLGATLPSLAIGALAYLVLASGRRGEMRPSAT